MAMGGYRHVVVGVSSFLTVTFQLLLSVPMLYFVPLSGIIVADTQSSVHVIDATGKYLIASKASSMYSIEINSEQMITFLPVELLQ